MNKIITLIFLVYGTFSYSQTQKLKLRLLKPNDEVDSLMKIVINNSYNKNICFSFTTIYSPYGYVFSILRLGKRHSKIYYHALQPKDVKDIGYFVSEKFIVFVSGDEKSNPYFRKTSVFRTFKIISLRDTTYWFTPDSLFKYDPEHRNGKFYFGSKSYRDKPQIIKQKN